MLQTFIAVINYNFYLFRLRRNHFNFDHLKDDFHIHFRGEKKAHTMNPCVSICGQDAQTLTGMIKWKMTEGGLASGEKAPSSIRRRRDDKFTDTNPQPSSRPCVARRRRKKNAVLT